MSLRHAVLGLLALEPGTGYELTQRFDRSMSNAWYASHSQIYPELAKLQEAGLVEVVGEGARRSRTYGVTPAGQEELRRWLVEVPPSRAQRNESAVRTFLTPLLDPQDQRIALQRDLDDALAKGALLADTETKMCAMGGHPFAPAVDLGRRFNVVLEAWLRDQLAALETERPSPADR